MFRVISVQFDLRNTLPKLGPFLLGQPVYIYIYIYITLHEISYCWGPVIPCRQKDRHTSRSWLSFFADIWIIYLFFLSVAIQTVAIPTWHTVSSLHNILLQFPQHTALKTTKPPADRTLLDRLTRYILCIFLFQYTSCVILSISSYKRPYITPPTRSVNNQFHYQWSTCKAVPHLLLTNYNTYCYKAVGVNAHCTEH